MSSEEVCEVVITAPSADWLASFTRDLVNERLCACGHNLAEIRSIYRWRGTVYDEREGRVALHTRLSLVPAIVRRVNSQHPYEVACVVAFPVIDGNDAYLRWVLEETDPGLQVEH